MSSSGVAPHCIQRRKVAARGWSHKRGSLRFRWPHGDRACRWLTYYLPDAFLRRPWKGGGISARCKQVSLAIYNEFMLRLAFFAIIVIDLIELLVLFRRWWSRIQPADAGIAKVWTVVQRLRILVLRFPCFETRPLSKQGQLLHSWPDAAPAVSIVIEKQILTLRE